MVKGIVGMSRGGFSIHSLTTSYTEWCGASWSLERLRLEIEPIGGPRVGQV